MSVLDDLKAAATAALSAGAAAVRAQGQAIDADFEQLIKPNLDATVAQMAGITDDLVAGNIGADQARSDLATQRDNIPTLMLAAGELSELALQIVVTAVVDALKSTIDAAAGMALL